jgi:Methyltransferase domain
MTVAVPWQMKLASKVVASNLRIPYSALRHVGVSKLGAMLRPDYAREVYGQHLVHANDWAETLLEIGPGDSLFTSVFAHGRFKSVDLIDAGHFAVTAPQIYIDLAESLRNSGECLPDLKECSSTEEILSALNCRYFTNGVASLANLKDKSVGFSFSHTVIQHLPLYEFSTFARELYRVTTAGGTSSHVVDFKDMLKNSLNHLRFSERTWESSLLKRCNAYTNRLRFSQMIRAFSNEGFDVEVLRQSRWDVVPLRRAALHEQFRKMDDDDLLTYGAHLLLRKSASL